MTTRLLLVAIVTLCSALTHAAESSRVPQELRAPAPALPSIETPVRRESLTCTYHRWESSVRPIGSDLAYGLAITVTNHSNTRLATFSAHGYVSAYGGTNTCPQPPGNSEHTVGPGAQLTVSVACGITYVPEESGWADSSAYIKDKGHNDRIIHCAVAP